jgi:hypothetical protein
LPQNLAYCKAWIDTRWRAAEDGSAPSRCRFFQSLLRRNLAQVLDAHHRGGNPAARRPITPFGSRLPEDSANKGTARVSPLVLLDDLGRPGGRTLAPSCCQPGPPALVADY